MSLAGSRATAPLWKVFRVQTDGTLDAGRTFFDGTKLFRERKQGLPDGLKVDQAGNVFATGPGGVLVIAPLAEITERVRRRVIRWFRRSRLIDAAAAADMLTWENSGFSIDASVQRRRASR